MVIKVFWRKVLTPSIKVGFFIACLLGLAMALQVFVDILESHATARIKDRKEQIEKYEKELATQCELFYNRRLCE